LPILRRAASRSPAGAAVVKPVNRIAAHLALEERVGDPLPPDREQAALRALLDDEIARMGGESEPLSDRAAAVLRAVVRQARERAGVRP
jgi:hypothetical protein